MDFIIGGAYQGKLDYAKAFFGINEDEIYTCIDNINFDKKCIYKLEEFTFWCVKNNNDTIAIFKAHAGEWRNSVLICEDIFCGVVPIGADMRAWREATGRLCAFLSHEAATVTRMFCGLPQRLK